MNANASYIVDTGSVVNEVNNITVTASTQFFAVEFILDQAYYITGIDVWAKGNNEAASNLSVRIYPDGGEIPSGRAIYDMGMSISQTLTWQNATISDLTLGAGSYWVAFEKSGAGGVFFPIGSDNPQQNAARKTVGFNWTEDDAFAAMGLRIEGTAVPIPPALWPFGSGLLVLIGMVRKKASR